MFGKNNTTTFGSPKSNSIYKEIRNYVIGQHTLSVMNAFENNNLDHSDPLFVDDCKQNLLHLAVKMNNANLTKYFLNHNVSKYEKNIFGETPIDIAVKNRNMEIISMLFGTDQLEMYIKKNKILENDKEDLGSKYTNLIATNNKIKKESVVLSAEIDRITNKYDEMRVANANNIAISKHLQKCLDNEKQRYNSKVSDYNAVESDYRRMKLERDNLMDDYRKVDNEKKTLKRKADESLVLDSNLKKMKTELSSLTNENNTLKQINSTLRNNMRK